MLDILKEKKDLRSKKISKIEKIKQTSTPLEALNRLKELKLTDSDKSYFLKSFGCFYKEETNDYMIRVRVRKLSKQQAKKIGEIAKEYGKDYIDLTTRSQIELRYIKEEDLYFVLKSLEDVNITTYQTGVDNFRGIIIDPLSGFSQTSIIDEREIVKEIEEIFLKKDDELSALPRKFNIAFCGNIKNSSNVFTQDLGLVLSKKDGIYGFRAFLGGKVGIIGVDSNIFLTIDEVSIFFKGIKELFKNYGYRDNRNKNRFYYLLKEVGIENFIKALEEFCNYKFTTGGEVLTQEDIEYSFVENLKNNKKAYKFIVPSGVFSGTDLIEASKLLDNDSFISFTFDQNFYIVNCDDSIADTILYKKYQPNTYVNNLIACAGIKTCSYAMIENKPDAIKLAKTLDKLVPTDGVIKFHWSACIKGCGLSGIGDFGFVGAKIKKDGKIVAGVDIYIGGNSKKEGKKVLKTTLDNLPKMIKPLIKFYNENKKQNETYTDFFKRNPYSIWANAFVMKLNLIFEFVPSFKSEANKIELFEIKDIANQIFYKLTKTHSIDNIFTPLKVKTLKELGYKGEFYQLIDNMLNGKYKVWSEIIILLDSIDQKL